MAKKKRIVKPCIDCGDPGGRTRDRGNGPFVVRTNGRCEKCTQRAWRQKKKSQVFVEKLTPKKCEGCGHEADKIGPKGQCRVCYNKSRRRSRRIPCIDCKTVEGKVDRVGRPIRIKGRCRSCHDAWREEELSTPSRCITCGKECVGPGSRGRSLLVSGKCPYCYRKHLRITAAAEKKVVARRAAPCVTCGTEGGNTDKRYPARPPIRKRGMCLRCYNRWAHWGGNLPPDDSDIPALDRDVIWKSASEIKGKRFAKLGLTSADPDFNAKMTEEQKRKRSGSWLRQLLEAERALSQWVLKKEKEAAQEALAPGFPPALLSA